MLKWDWDAAGGSPIQPPEQDFATPPPIIY